uniref:Ankyrin repeat and SOCS box containing 13 n=2 Tax=Monodelphis domestica TaxID=13616 RepID=A0A5F8GS11_MONDO
MAVIDTYYLRTYIDSSLLLLQLAKHQNSSQKQALGGSGSSRSADSAHLELRWKGTRLGLENYKSQRAPRATFTRDAAQIRSSAIGQRSAYCIAGSRLRRSRRRVPSGPAQVPGCSEGKTLKAGDPVDKMDLRNADSALGEIGFWVDRTPVHEAAQQGETLQLQQLIENGACVNLVTVDSITPLHEASLQGQTQCVKLLLAAGAQVDARNIDGSTPLCDACASGSIECVKLLLSHGAKVNPPLYTASPLHEACMSGSSECVRLLIDVGANLEAHDCHFGTPLHVACAREHLDCVKVLLNAGANVNAAKLHETALHHAAKVKNVDLIEMLVEFGGNIYARDNRGKKPSDYTWSSSASAKCFEYYEKTPLSLSQLCRVSLRKATGVRGLEKIAKLNIPPRLINYLSYN